MLEGVDSLRMRMLGQKSSLTCSCRSKKKAYIAYRNICCYCLNISSYMSVIMFTMMIHITELAVQVYNCAVKQTSD